MCPLSPPIRPERHTLIIKADPRPGDQLGMHEDEPAVGASLRGSGFAGDAVAIDLSQLAGRLGFYGFFEHAQDCVRRARLDNPSTRRHFVDSHQRCRNHDAFIAERRVRLCQLQRGLRQAVAVRHRRVCDRRPFLVRRQAAALLTRKADAGNLAEAELRQRGPHVLRGQRQRDFCHADVTRTLKNGCEIDPAEVARVLDRIPPDFEIARRGIDHVAACVVAAFQRRRDDKRLDARAGLNNIDDAAIAAEVTRRLEALKAKNWPEADRIRDELTSQGILLKDSKDSATGERITSWEVKR